MDRASPEAMDRKTLIDALRRSSHEIQCSDRSSLAAVYDAVAQTPWVDACDVDLPSLRLVLRIVERTRTPADATERWLLRVERMARGA